jgi:hypothetical protein
MPVKYIRQQPMMSSCKMLISFRAAVSLNNMAVCTLERGHFDAAMETLADSLLVMNSIVNQPWHERTTCDPQTLDDEKHSSLVLQDKLEAARMRLAQSRVQPLIIDEAAAVEIRPSDDGNVTAMKVPLMRFSTSSPPPSPPPPPPPRTVFIPIRLESSSVTVNDEIPRAVILYNHALSQILIHIIHNQ